MRIAAQRGALIVFEGCDRSGKTTAVKRLVDYLNDKHQLTKEDCPSAKMMRFPDRGTHIGQVINDYLKGEKELDDHVIHLLFSTNRWEKREELTKALDAGQHVLIDRYAYSGVAFSAAKAGMDLDWCRGPDRGLPKPDLVCFLDVSPEEASKRGDYGMEKYENKEFQAKVRDNYKILREEKLENWEVINTDGKTQDQVFAEIEKVVKSVLTMDKGSIEQLWPMK